MRRLPHIIVCLLLCLGSVPVTALTTAEANPTIVLIVYNDKFVVNGLAFASLQELHYLLKPDAQQTVIVSGHACADTVRIARAIETVKEIGYENVVLESFGLFQDAECTLPPKQRWWRRKKSSP